MLHLEDRHIRDCRKLTEEMLAKLALLASGRRISRKIETSRRLDLDVICFSDEKIFRVDAVAPGHRFHTFSLGNRCNVTFRPPSGIHHAKMGVAMLRRPSQVGLTSPWTLLASDVAWPALSPDLSPNDNGARRVNATQPFFFGP